MLINQFQSFKELHFQEHPLYLFNCWDIMSAKIVESKGAKAIATSSYAVSDAWGYEDGEDSPFTHLVRLSQQLVKNSKVPVSIDAEGLYSNSLKTLYANAQSLFATGISGINFEDKKYDSSWYTLWSIDEQAKRIQTLKQASGDLNIEIFINSRTDLFLREINHSTELVKEAIQRAEAYAAAGADGIFIPGLTQLDLIEEFCKNSPLPVNIMLKPYIYTENIEWKNIGVSRLSYGPHFYLHVQDILAKHLTFNV